MSKRFMVYPLPVPILDQHAVPAPNLAQHAHGTATERAPSITVTSRHVHATSHVLPHVPTFRDHIGRTPLPVPCPPLRAPHPTAMGCDPVLIAGWTTDGVYLRA